MCSKTLQSALKLVCCVGTTAVADLHHLPLICRCNTAALEPQNEVQEKSSAGGSFELVNCKTHRKQGFTSAAYSSLWTAWCQSQ